MKNLIALFIITFYSLTVTVGQSVNKNDLSRLSLNGKVKTTKQRFYDALGENGNFTKGKANSGDSNTYEDVDTEFDEMGNIKTQSRLRFKDESLVEMDIYKYEHDRLVEIVTNDSKGNPIKKTVFEYDAQGNKIKELFYIRLDGKPLITSYTYTNKGLLEKIANYGGTSTEYKYDISGKTIEKKEKSDGHTWVTVYTYNDKNQIIRSEKYRDKKIFENINYTDDNGKLKPVKSNIVLEEVDKQNNWIKRVKLSHGTYFYIEREITYYE